MEEMEAAVAADWNPELIETLHRLVHAGDRKVERLEPALRQLERRHGEMVYAELIFLLAQLRFPAVEARQHWQSILAHKEGMSASLGQPVDLLVALVSYFVEVQKTLQNPVIMELKLFQQTQESAYRDELTGLFNYRYFREYLVREIHRGERYDPPLSLVMIDIDNFKAYNDEHGHEAGNTALTSMASLLGESLRKVDVAARYGGEEFALILPSTSKASAFRVADRARRKIEEFIFPIPASVATGRLSVSMGIATFPADARDAGELVRKADSAMYSAKSNGKNCVKLFGQDRRSYRRLDANLVGRFCALAAEYHALTTTNISEGGLRFIINRQIAVSTLLDLVLVLPGMESEIAVSGRVVRVEESGDGQFEAALRFMDLNGGDRILLGKYLHELADQEDSAAAESAPEATAP